MPFFENGCLLQRTHVNNVDSSPEKIHELLIKLKIWESGLANHFEDRIDNNDMDPMWARLIEVCI